MIRWQSVKVTRVIQWGAEQQRFCELDTLSFGAFQSVFMQLQHRLSRLFSHLTVVSYTVIGRDSVEGASLFRETNDVEMFCPTRLPHIVFLPPQMITSLEGNGEVRKQQG